MQRKQQVTRLERGGGLWDLVSEERVNRDIGGDIVELFSINNTTEDGVI